MTINKNFNLLHLVCQDCPDLKKTGLYWIGPCPFCGGKDRFNLKRTRDIDLWICRNCGDGKYKDAADYLMKRNGWNFVKTVKYMNGEDYDLPERDITYVSHEEQVRQKILDKKLEQFTTEEIWEALHRRIEQDEKHREWWRSQGVPDSWQDYLSLGYTPAQKYTCSDSGNLAESPAYTIPYFHYSNTGRKFVTIQYRFCDTKSPADRYRFEYGLGTTFYMTTPTIAITDRVIICEGAKKAIVAKTFTPDNDITVIGVPSKMDWGDVVESIKNCGIVWVVLDPDAGKRARLLAQRIGDNARVVELPMKVDDAFMSGGLYPDLWMKMLRQGVKV